MSPGRAMKSLGAWEPCVSSTPVRDRTSELRLTPAQKAAHKFAKPWLDEGYDSDGLYTYRDENGRPLHWVLRTKSPDTGKKWIRPMHWNGSEFALGLPQYERGAKPLYGLHLLAQRPGEHVLVCEGEKCAAKLQKLGLLAITSGGATSAEGADWGPLAGRRILVWPDHDDAGQSYAEDVVQCLTELGCNVEVIDASQLALGKGEDAVDWLKAHPEATKDTILCLPHLAKAEGASVAAGAGSLAAPTLRAHLESIASWCAERCIRDSRVWGNVATLYLSLCSSRKAENVPTFDQFLGTLAQLGVVVTGEFAKGLALAQDFANMETPFA